MATLKIYNDIVGEDEKIMLQMWEGIDGVCYKDIASFISAMDEDDDVIDIRIHCRGGDCIEGWAIHDALRRSKKTITCTVEGECSSMATIILLAAPLERRFAYKNAHFCIHNPALACPDLNMSQRLTADALEDNIDQLQIQASALRDEQEKILNLYVQRTSASRTELQNLMDKDTYVTTDTAIEMGFISKTLTPLTAHKNRTFNIKSQTTRKMNKKTVSGRGILNRLRSKASRQAMKALVVTAADGSELTVEREEGDPQVGDTASPDGNFILEDGTEIDVEGGVITQIITPDGTVVDEGLDEEELIEKVEELETENEELTEAVEQLEEELEALKGARILSADEKVILAKVAKAGGRKWLDKVLDSKSTYTASNTRFVETRSVRKRNAGESSTQAAIRKQREAAEAKRAARRK